MFTNKQFIEKSTQQNLVNHCLTFIFFISFQGYTSFYFYFYLENAYFCKLLHSLSNYYLNHIDHMATKIFNSAILSFLLFHFFLNHALTALLPLFSPTDYDTSIVDKRQYLLGLVNELRQDLGRSSLYSDITLNLIAQRHSQDMIDNNFFSHKNLNNESPMDRAYKVGFLNVVGENIAFSPGFNLTQLHFSLMKSSFHYSNTINPDWTRIGFGVTFNTTHTFLTVLFSSRDFILYPITQKQRIDFFSELRIKIETKNKFTGQPPFRQQLSNNLEEYLKTERTLTFGQYMRLQNYKFQSLARRYYPTTQWTSTLADRASDLFKNISKDPSPYFFYGVGLFINSTTIEVWIAFHR